ncbi:diablo IAP-binding mitochondrial protein-like isoform X2 [Watersipora subatra]|uniref:diablo IAP-binding mitochondrial protein-like isoform X2 n=1 Tax=Watersipora subatra TaxID=2589382 RepID=UPI00355B757B
MFKRHCVFAVLSSIGIPLGLNYHRIRGHVHAHQAEELPSPDFDHIKSLVEAEKEISWKKVTMRSTTAVSSSVSGLVEVTATRQIECETLYHKYLQMLTELLQEYIKAIGTPNADELWDTIMFLRGYLAEVKDERKNLSLLWANCRGLAEHAGQAAFHTGSELSAYRLGEVLVAADANMASLNKLSTNLEIDLAKLEAEEIRKSVEHEKRKHQQNISSENGEKQVSD